MKKAFIILAILAFATPSFAAIINSDSTTVIGGAAFKPSTLVNVDLEVSDSNYSVASKHLNGSKYYASTNNDAVISSDDCAVGDALADGTVTAADALATACVTQ